MRNMARTNSGRRHTTTQYPSGAFTRFWIGMFVAFLFLKSTAGSFWSEENRFFFHWQRTDVLGIVLAISVTACIFFVAYEMARRMGRWTLWAAQLFFVGFSLFYLKVNLSEALRQQIGDHAAVSFTLKAAVVLAVVAFLLKRRPVVRLVRAICLILSPILLIYFFTLAGAATYEGSRGDPNAKPGLQASDRPVARICIIVFDEWSYARAFTNGQPIAELPETARAAEQSIVFHNAYSPAPQTFDSLPSTLCGVKGKSELRDGTIYLQTDDGTRRCDEYSHFFKEMKKEGYRTALYGNYLPYAELFKTDLDYCESHDIYKILGKNPIGVGAAMLLENAKIRLGWIHPIMSRPHFYFKHRFFAEMATRFQNSALREIRAAQPSFVFFHYPVPHVPFIFDRHGARPNLSDPSVTDIPHYMANVRYTDTLLGQILDAADASQVGERTILIFTSDHSFRADPVFGTSAAEKKEVRHIPLLVHLPGQTGRIDCSVPFSTASLKSVLREYLHSDLSVEAFTRLCEDHADKEDR